MPRSDIITITSIKFKTMMTALKHEKITITGKIPLRRTKWTAIATRILKTENCKNILRKNLMTIMRVMTMTKMMKSKQVTEGTPTRKKRKG